jgi:hypothetical protein
LLHWTIAFGKTNAILPISNSTRVIASLRQLDMNKLSALVFTVAAAAAGLASAQPASTASPLSPIYACAEKTIPAERLACFDTAVAQVKAAEARSEIVTMDQPRVAAVRREAFGFRIPSFARFGLGGAGAAAGASASAPKPADDQIDEQDFAVARVGQAGSRVSLVLTNGNVWNLVEDERFNAPRQTPFNVRIKSASMGSYILSVEGRNKGYRVRRVQ